jgi:uncharacterized protein (TIGR02217 family)
MTLLRTRLSDHITRGSRGGPTKPDRRIVRDGSGRIAKIVYLNDLLPHRYDISYGMKLKADFEEVLACYHVIHGGGYEGFLHKDWNDYEATEDNSAVELISGTTYRLQRKYTFGAANCFRDIVYPVADTVVIYSSLGAVLSHTLDEETGIVTVSSGSPSYWSGEFDVPVTFADDAMDSIELNGIDGDELLGLPSVRLEELP